MKRLNAKAIFSLTSLSLVAIAVLMSSNTTVVGAKASSTRYSGEHSEWVGKLLDRSGEFRCPAADGSDGGSPPKVATNACMRDKYVAAGVLYAWAAECYARSEQDNKAVRAAKSMIEQLQNAEQLCSGSRGGGCDTDDVYKCGELGK